MSVNLNTASSFAILANTTITNTGSTFITGDVGIYAGSSITGFESVIVNGTIYRENTTEAIIAKSDLTAAYLVAAALTPSTNIPTELGGYIYGPGVYKSSSTTFEITNTLTLSGPGQYVFQMDSTLVTASGSVVSLLNGANSCDIFWQVGSSATLGTNSTFAGSILAYSSISAQSGAKVDGRLLAQVGAVTLDTNNINNICVCYVKGTKILTKNGYKNIENIKVGDNVSTFGNIKNKKVTNKSNGQTTQKVIFAGYFTKSILGDVSKPIVFRKNAFGNNMPFEDVAVSPGHGVIVNNKLVLAEDLVNGDSIYQSDNYNTVTYYHLELENHCVINAGGLLGESLLGCQEKFTPV